MVTQATDKAGPGRSETSRAGQAMPQPVRIAIAASVGVLLVGAVYLISVRGEALLVDLAKLGAALCF